VFFPAHRRLRFDRYAPQYGRAQETNSVESQTQLRFRYGIDRRISDLFYLDELALSDAGSVPTGENFAPDPQKEV